MPMHSLADLLKSRQRQLPQKGALHANRVCQQARAWVAATWGSDVLELVRLCTFRNETLSLGVTSSAFAEELRLRQQELCFHLRAALPRSKAPHIRVFISGG